ncbi:MAG: hypothetical protein II313_00805 [Anaerotignum sp.]|nr:hypothetical protein [Anaerotignum sp.]
MQTKTQMIKEILKSVLGLFIFSIGVYLTIQADIGLAPWDCLSMGVSGKVGYSYGIVHTVISIIILVIDILLKEKIGYGTILDALLVGNYVDLIDHIITLPQFHSIPISCIMVIIGLFIMGYGQYFYMDAAQGCGPRDSLLIALGKRFPKTPIGVVQTALVGIALLIGWLLGGPVGIGTVISVFGMGTALQIVCKILHFEPRDVVHKNIFETNRIFFQK